MQFVLVLDVAFHGLHADGEELRGVIALHRIDVRLAARLLLESLAERGVLRIVQPIAIVQRRLDPVGRSALGLERALRQEAGAT